MQIQSTTRYEKFQLGNNRDVSEKHVDLLARCPSFAENFKYKPIKVDGDLRIIDGQHRYLAAKQLNIPIYYVIKHDACFEDIRDSNTRQRPWDLKDYITVYAKKEMKAYQFMKSLMEHPFNLRAGISRRIFQYFSYSGNRMEFPSKFKEGMLVLKNQDVMIEFVEYYSDLLREMTRVKGHDSITLIYTDHYCKALIYFYKQNLKGFKILLHKIPDFYPRLCVVKSQEEAVKILEKIISAKPIKSIKD